MPKTNVYKMADLKKHETSDSLWLLIRGKVYDVTEFADEHPGGEEVLLDASGRDATQDFDDVGHSDEAIDMLKEYLIGTVSDLPKKTKSSSKSSSTASDDGRKSTSLGVWAVIGVVSVAVLARVLGYLP